MIKYGMILAVVLAALCAHGETVRTATQPWVRNYVATNGTSLAAATNYTNRALADFAATGTVWRSASYGTTNRWTDATGCVWQVVFPHFTEWEFSGVPSGYTFFLSAYTGSLPGYSWALERNGGGEYYQSDYYVEHDNLTSLDIPTPIANVTCSREWIDAGTNLIGRVALTNDVTAEIRKQSLGGIWDSQLEVWWTPVMENGALRYCATTNVNMEAHQ